MTRERVLTLERAIGTKEHLIKTCETARHFVVRLVPDLAFVAGLPARILAAKAATECEDLAMLTVLQTLSGVVRKGCSSPELLANAVHLKTQSRPSARASFAKVENLIQPTDPYEGFDNVLARVRLAHELAEFDDL